MATNKTRIAFVDSSGALPYQFGMVLEFDIYQDAIDYVETYANTLVAIALDYTWEIYLYSYDNDSYRYREEAGELQKTDWTFPNLAS